MWFEKRGLVTKIKEEYCIILTGEGTYERIPVPAAGTKIGAEIAYPNFIISSAIKPLLLVASFLILFFGYTLFRQATLPKAMAYVSLDINPSLEMSVDRNLNVIDVKYFNSDAANLLMQENLQGKNLYDALTVVINKAIKQNYIKTNQVNLIISTVSSSDADANSVDQKAVQQVLEKSIKTDGFTGEVKTYSVTDEFRSTAEEKGLSPGKFLIYEQLVKTGNKISIDEVRQNKIGKLVTTYKVDLLPNFKKIRMQKGKSDQEPEVLVDDNGNDVPISATYTGNNKSGDVGKDTHPQKNVDQSDTTRKPDLKQDRRTGGQDKNVHGAQEIPKKRKQPEANQFGHRKG